jgi:hypothetical protein
VRSGKRPTLATAAPIALVGSNWTFRGNLPCRECDGTGWVLYRSETVEGEFGEAYRLCPNCCAPRFCAGSSDGHLCSRPATVRCGQGYYCEEHIVVVINDGKDGTDTDVSGIAEEAGR